MQNLMKISQFTSYQVDKSLCNDAITICTVHRQVNHCCGSRSP